MIQNAGTGTFRLGRFAGVGGEGVLNGGGLNIILPVLDFIYHYIHGIAIDYVCYLHDKVTCIWSIALVCSSIDFNVYPRKIDEYPTLNHLSPLTLSTSNRN